jgi:hypothetical protein
MLDESQALFRGLCKTEACKKTMMKLIMKEAAVYLPELAPLGFWWSPSGPLLIPF